jgi:hypothetical protein
VTDVRERSHNWMRFCCGYDMFFESRHIDMLEIPDDELQDNPLLEFYRDKYGWSMLHPRKRDAMDRKDFSLLTAREEATKRWAWAIPNNRVLDIIASYSPLVEIGAGTGYWAERLAKRGANIICYDAFPPDGTLIPDEEVAKLRPNMSPFERFNAYHNGAICYYPVHRGGPEKAGAFRMPARGVLPSSDRNLFLCWPPYSSLMGAQCLVHHAGEYVLYIGEGDGGCTGEEAFHRILERFYDEVDAHAIPQWDGIHDALFVYRRKDQVRFTFEDDDGDD